MGSALGGNRLVGKLDATADREAGILRVNAIRRDLAFTETITAAVRREIRELAHWRTGGPQLPVAASATSTG